MPYTHYHPVYLDLKGRRILIVGGGAIALEKLNSLLGSGGKITVISPEARAEIRDWDRSGALTWVRRNFRPEDVEPAYMVIAATDDPELNALVYRCGNEKQRLSNSVDDPANCNFIMSAITRRGPMQVAVSSAGCSPALAQRVRDKVMREILTEEVGELAEFLGDRRSEVKSRLPGYKVRQAFWERVIDSQIPSQLAAGKTRQAEAGFQDMLAAAVSYAPGDFPQVAEPIKGSVTLVGAGPGSPDLITVRGLRALQQADVVLYDRLVHPDLLEQVPAHCERIYVGKEVGHMGKGRQRWINDQLIEHARAGRRVVRLKGGDPFVFGRGGEECLALQEAGIDFEVVAGISSAISAASAAGIPVTHRGVATAFGVFAGHEAEGRDDVPWDVAAKLPTAVFLMGVDRLDIIASRLTAEGRSLDTPVAVVSKATLPEQFVVAGTLRDIAEKANGVAAPAVIVVGEVVNVMSRVPAELTAANF